MQLDFAGRLGVADGRYLVRDGDREPGQRVLVFETTGAPPPPRRRRRPKQIEPGTEPSPLALTRATAIRAHEPFGSADEAAEWLTQTLADEDSIDAAIAEAVAVVNRALHAHAVAAADPFAAEIEAGKAVALRVGYGSGNEVAAGRFTEASEVAAERSARSRRRRREEDLRPQERVAAVLGGREQLDACETLVLRARADLDAGRRREAALQLRVALEALLVELDGALADSGHEQDMAELGTRRSEAGEAANAALGGELPLDDERKVTELTELCERVLRRRRVLRG